MVLFLFAINRTIIVQIILYLYCMATVNFLYRSKRPESFLTIRLLYRNQKDYVIGAKTKLKVSKEYWETTHQRNLKDIRDVDQRNTYNAVNTELARIQAHVLDEFDKTDIGSINKDWLVNTLEGFYNPAGDSERGIPKDLISYIDFYKDYRKNELNAKAVRRLNVTKHKMQRLQSYLGKTILIKEINEDFKQAFQEFSQKESYSQNTQSRELVSIKTLCFHAHYLGLETHHQLNSLRLKKQEVNHVYLTKEEIEKIKGLELPNEHLDNARDWLLISCYTGQRVSDFMRFTKDMIRVENGKHLLEFRQQKTKKLMTIPFSREAREVLKKRGGEFPRPISDQKYNDYIKVVCQKAELNEEVQGTKRVNITPKEKKGTYRHVADTYEKWELVSSHIGRRSFATNYYGRVPTSYLINITGHSSEKTFLNYIKKSNKDIALDAYEYFN